MPSACLIVTVMKELNDCESLFYSSLHPVCSISKQHISF